MLRCLLRLVFAQYGEGEVDKSCPEANFAQIAAGNWWALVRREVPCFCFAPGGIKGLTCANGARQ